MPPSDHQHTYSPAPEPEVADQPTGISVEVYHSPSPIPGLIRETSLLSLANVPVPPQSPHDPLHQRSGAALHYQGAGLGFVRTEGRRLPMEQPRINAAYLLGLQCES